MVIFNIILQNKNIKYFYESITINNPILGIIIVFKIDVFLI